MSPPMYRDPSSGYWGFPSSTMDWCEENYAVTSFVAEFCKSMLSLFLEAAHLTQCSMFFEQFSKKIAIFFFFRVLEHGKIEL